MNINEMMEKIIKNIDELKNLDHCEICNIISEKYCIFTSNNKGEIFFPVWLSRIVEGRLKDIENNEVESI